MSITLNTLLNQLLQAQPPLAQEQQRVAGGKHLDRPSAELTQQHLDDEQALLETVRSGIGDAALDVAGETFDVSLLDCLR